MYYLGIDPGLEGAFVILKDQNIHEVHLMPLIKTAASKKRISPVGLKELVGHLATFKDMKVSMEYLMNTPGKQGTFAFGDGYGMVRGMLVYAGLPPNYVLPKHWKKDVMPNMPADKIASCVAAARLYPEAKAYMLKPRGGLHDGIGDAICIAEWGRRNLK